MKWLRNTGWSFVVFGMICVTSSTLFGWGEKGAVVVFDGAAAEMGSVRAGGACYIDNTGTNCPAYSGAATYCKDIECDASNNCPSGTTGKGGHMLQYRGQCPNAAAGAQGKATCSTIMGFCNSYFNCGATCTYRSTVMKYYCGNGSAPISTNGSAMVTDYSSSGATCTGVMGE